MTIQLGRIGRAVERNICDPVDMSKRDGRSNIYPGRAAKGDRIGRQKGEEKKKNSGAGVHSRLAGLYTGSKRSVDRRRLGWIKRFEGAIINNISGASPLDKTFEYYYCQDVINSHFICHSRRHFDIDDPNKELHS